jgi:hypothetical protein
MAGCWEQKQADSWTEECWTRPRGGMMLGSGRSGHGDVIDDWETMQIVLDQGSDDGPVVRMAFWAAPNGGSRTLFGWQPDEEPGLTFFNLANDYPQRIRYWREGDALMAEISMADGSKRVRWTYRRLN